MKYLSYKSNSSERIKNILRNAYDWQIEKAYQRIGILILKYYQHKNLFKVIDLIMDERDRRIACGKYLFMPPKPLLSWGKIEIR